MAETVHVNMNDTIEVTLTAEGLAVFRANERREADVCALAGVTTDPHHMPDHVWRGTMWEAFEIFGAHISMGSPVPFDKNELRIPRDDKATK